MKIEPCGLLLTLGRKVDVAELPGLCPRGGADPAHNRGSHAPVPQPLVLETGGSTRAWQGHNLSGSWPMGSWTHILLHEAVSTFQHRKPQGLTQRGHSWPSRDATFLLTCFSLFLLFLGFTQGVGNPVSCARNKGICVPIRCPGNMKQIGTCVGQAVKCCRKK